MVEPLPWPKDARRDRLIGDWHIYQRTGGHRTSTDDLITAWYACHRTVETPQRYLDLGCGIGSVLLMVTHRLRPPVADGIEAQHQSVVMAERAIKELPPSAPVIAVRHADFRQSQLVDHYDLITASPPYFPLASGVLPSDAQRRACRFEERGGVEDYLKVAATALSRAGRLYLVFQTVANRRVLSAADEVGLHHSGQVDFVMRQGREKPFLTVFEFRREPAAEIHRARITIRATDGAVTEAYQSVRAELGFAADGSRTE